MPKPKIQLDHGGMQDVLNGRGTDVEAPLMAYAEKVAARARATAPVDTGAYRDSIHVELGHTDRVVARVVASDRKAPIVEAKTGNLKRALGR